MANFLDDYDVSNHGRVGLFLDRSASMAAGILGVLKTGSALVPYDVNFVLTNRGNLRIKAGDKVAQLTKNSVEIAV